MYYRRYPEAVEAMQLPKIDEDPSPELMEWLDKQEAEWYSDRDGGILIVTSKGNLRANPGDWIVRGDKGELYPCKPHRFMDTYYSVEKVGQHGRKL